MFVSVLLHVPQVGEAAFNPPPPPPTTQLQAEWRTQGPCSWFQGDLAGCELFFQSSRVFVTQFWDKSVTSCSVGKQRAETRLDLIGLVRRTQISAHVQESFPHERRSACIKTVKNLVRCLCRTCCKSTHNPNRKVTQPIRGQHRGSAPGMFLAGEGEGPDGITMIAVVTSVVWPYWVRRVKCFLIPSLHRLEPHIGITSRSLKRLFC